MTVLVSKPALNLREELSALKKPTGIAGAAMLAADTVAEQQALLGVGRRNWIINGAHTVNQRGLLPVTGVTHNTYQLTDRWRTMLNGVTGNAELVTTNQPSINPKGKSLKFTATSSGTGFIGAYQIVEDYSVFAGKQVTVSGWVKTTVASGFRLYDGSSQHFGEKLNTNGQWVFTSFTTTLPESLSSLQLYFEQFTGAGAAITSGNYVEFTMVQLELGNVATPFEHRSYGEELALCRRYFITSATSTNSGVSFGHTSGGSQWLYATLESQVLSKMRAAPTVSYSGATGTWTTALSYGVYYAKDTIYAYHESSGAQADVYGNVYWKADSEL